MSPTTRNTLTDAYLTVFENLATPVILLDADGRVCNLNHEAARLLQAARLPTDTPFPRGQPVEAIFPWLPSTHELHAFEARAQKFECAAMIDGQERVFEGRVSGLVDSSAKPAGDVVVLNDVTEHKALTARLKRLARTDGLTGVNNRRHLLTLAERETARARRYARPLSVLLIDVDHFKQVNDSYGHAAGDEVLVRLTRAMLAMLRSTDALGRLGGDEFAILLPETDAAAAFAAGQRIRACVRQRVIGTATGAVRPTVSIGVAALDPSDRGFEELLERGDDALYQAKAHGRNIVVAASLGRSRRDSEIAAGRGRDSGTFPLDDETFAMRERTRRR